MIIVCVIGLFLGTGVFPTVGAATNDHGREKDKGIDISIATQVAFTALNDLDKNSYSINSYTEIFNKEGTGLCFCFSLRPQGYLVISASYNLPPVIAYSFTSDFQNPSEPNVLSDLLITDLTLRFENLKYLPESVIEERHLQWDSYLENVVLQSKQFEQWPPEGSTPTGGWLLTNWHQDAPYNNFCPLDIAHGGRSLAGCPAVAMAQILNYHATTNDIVFSDADDYYHDYNGNQYWIDNDYIPYGFPSFPQLNSYLQTLQYHYQNNMTLTNNDKAALNFACGVAATQVYGSGGSGTFSVNQAYDAYQRFSCASAVLLHDADPDLFPRLSNNMKEALPAHLAIVNQDWTSGHNLVIDGYNTDNYYHLNFGWGGSYNGWYLIPDDLPMGLTVIEGVILDIFKEDTGAADLSAEGTLSWTNVIPNKTVTGSFTVSNVGEPHSQLDWVISDRPSWGEWTFTPSEGNNLTPEDGPVTITVEVVAPDQENQLFTGQIKVQNVENSSDFEILPVSLMTGLKFGSDLSCVGSLTWVNVHPGGTVTGSFTVENIGQVASNLSWEITEWPDWGTWTFIPSHGENLTPEQGPITINVSVVAPNKKNTHYTGQITIVNTENSSDFETISVSLATPYIPHHTILDVLRILWERCSYVFSYLRHFLVT